MVVVTHLAQVAALAARHYVIDKTSAAAGAVTRLTLLQGEAVVEELCRMMGGRPDDARPWLMRGSCETGRWVGC